MPIILEYRLHSAFFYSLSYLGCKNILNLFSLFDLSPSGQIWWIHGGSFKLEAIKEAL